MNDLKYLQFRLAGLFFRMNLKYKNKPLPERDDLYAPQWALAYAGLCLRVFDCEGDEVLADVIEAEYDSLYEVANVA